MRLETNKTEKRRLRGLEVAQAALLLVIGVVVGLVLYFITVGMVAATPAPNIQVDSFNSFIAGSNAYLTLKFGKSGTVDGIALGNSWGAWIGGCVPADGRSFPLSVVAGQEYGFKCTLAKLTWSTKLLVRVDFADGTTYWVSWVTG